MDPVCTTPSARHLGHQFATVHRKSLSAASAVRLCRVPRRGFHTAGTQSVFPVRVPIAVPSALVLPQSDIPLPAIAAPGQRRSKKFFRCHAVTKLRIGVCAIVTQESLEETFPAESTCLAPLERSSSGDFGYETGGALGAGGG